LTSPSATQATSAAPDQPEAPTAGASSSSAAAAATATTSAAAADPLHHLPEAARRSLCGRSRSVRAPERGFNLTVYVASTGKSVNTLRYSTFFTGSASIVARCLAAPNGCTFKYLFFFH